MTILKNVPTPLICSD